MSNVTIRKFPITAPDGTHYRIKVDETTDIAGDPYIDISLYIPRKWFGFREVYQTDYYHDYIVYNAYNPDFIAIATAAVRMYYAHIEREASTKRKRLESNCRKQAALDRFAGWDGRITED